MKRIKFAIIALAAIVALSEVLFKGFSSQFGWTREMWEGIRWYGASQVAVGFCIGLVVMELTNKKSGVVLGRKSIIFSE